MQAVRQPAWQRLEALWQRAVSALDALQPAAQLAARLYVAKVFFLSGLTKIRDWETTLALFTDEYQVPLLDPALAARLATFVELGVPPLLFVGLAARLATLPLLAMIAVIQVFVYPNAWSDHLMWAAALLLVLTRGPGVVSLDYWIARMRRGHA